MKFTRNGYKPVWRKMGCEYCNRTFFIHVQIEKTCHTRKDEENDNDRRKPS